MFRCCFFLLAALSGSSFAAAATQEADPARLTVLYDNTAGVEGAQGDWGFACLVELGGKRVLFDSGTQDWVLRHNLEHLGIDLAGLDAIVLSHFHFDHTGALFTALAASPGVAVYLPASFPPEFERQVTRAGGRGHRIKQASTIFPGIRTTSEMGDEIMEVGLVVADGDKTILITGCAHPGIGHMTRTASKEIGGKIDTVLGGFHLMRTPEEEVTTIIAELKSLGVTAAGSSHCTGEEAIAAFREAFGERFIELGAGAVLELAPPSAAQAPKTAESAD